MRVVGNSANSAEYIRGSQSIYKVRLSPLKDRVCGEGNSTSGKTSVMGCALIIRLPGQEGGELDESHHTLGGASTVKILGETGSP